VVPAPALGLRVVVGGAANAVAPSFALTVCGPMRVSAWPPPAKAETYMATAATVAGDGRLDSTRASRLGCRSAENMLLSRCGTVVESGLIDSLRFVDL